MMIILHRMVGGGSVAARVVVRRHVTWRVNCRCLILVVILAVQGCGAIPPPRVRAPATASVGAEVTVTLKGTDPFDVHEYRVDFGDGAVTGWRKRTAWTHEYAEPGVVGVRGQERCPLGAFVTEWSKPRYLTVTEPAE